MNADLFSAVVFSAFVTTALASLTYHAPPLPCEWTLKWDCNGPFGYRTVVQQVNGRFMRIERVGSEYFTQEFVVRSDLNDSCLVVFEHTNDEFTEYTLAFDDAEDMYKIYTFADKEFYFNYEIKTSGLCDGRHCNIYRMNKTDSDVLYTDFNDYPFYWTEAWNKFNFTWEWKADLSVFRFPTSANFTDERIFTPPVEDDVTFWEKHSNDCIQYTGKCLISGNIEINRNYLCAGDVNHTNVCLNKRCGTAEDFLGNGAAVIINTRFTVTEVFVDTSELARFIEKDTHVKGKVALNVNSSGHVVQVVVFTENLDQANSVAEYAKSYWTCYDNILCQAKSVSVIPEEEVSSGHHDYSLCFFMLFFMMILTFIVH